MGLEELTTRQLIIDAGKKEFLEKGFRDASLRSIAKNANVTTGAFYGYFDGKEALFSTIVGPCAAAVSCRFEHEQKSFFELPSENDFDCINWMIDYMYDHYDVFKILLCCSDGTKYEQFVHNMVDLEVEATLKYIKKTYNTPAELDERLCHMVASGMFGGIFEAIIHDMPRDEAKQLISQLRHFNHAGWVELIK